MGDFDGLNPDGQQNSFVELLNMTRNLSRNYQNDNSDTLIFVGNWILMANSTIANLAVLILTIMERKTLCRIKLMFMHGAIADLLVC